MTVNRLRNVMSMLVLCGVCFASVAFLCPLFDRDHKLTSLSCSPLTIEFGQVLPGSVSEEALEVSYDGTIEKHDLIEGWFEPAVPRPSVRLAGFSSVDCTSDNAPFRVLGPFPLEMDPGEATDVTIQFVPMTAGAWQCVLTPEYTLVDLTVSIEQEEFDCDVVVNGSATGIGPEPSCALQPAPTIDYGSVEITSWIDRTLTIRNETLDLLTTNQFKYVLADPSADCRVFTIDPADTTGIIGPGESRDIVVRFAPDAAGDFECTRSLASLKEPATAQPEPITNACPTTVTWRGTGVIGAPVWNSCAPGGTNDWHGVSGVSGSEIYVAGDGGRVIASVGDCNWPASGTVFSDVNLRDIWAYSDGASTVAWAVGNIPPPPGTYGETGAILRMDGAPWYKVDEGIFVTYGAVWGSAFDDVYFVGTGISTDFPNAKQWNGTAFDTLHISPMGMSEVSGVSGNAANDIWAVLRQQTFSVYHYDGSDWTNETQPWMNKPLHDVWTVSGTGFYHAYAVGEDGAIYHFDGTHWTDESIPGETRDFYGVWVSSTGQVFVVGEGSVIYHSDGNNNWTEQTPSNVQGDLMDVWGASDSDVYAVGTNGVILRYTPPGP